MKKKGQPKKKKLKLRIKVVIKLLLTILVVAALIYYVTNLKIRNISITGTTNIKDVEIIEAANIKDYPKIYKLNLKKTKEQIESLPLVEHAKIKRTILGKIKIDIVEEKILFFYRYNNKYITSSGASIPSTDDYYGYPTLINFTPDTNLEAFINGLNKIDHNIIKMINEIEYTPYKSKDGTIIDNNRFTLKMNDTNTVLIDTVNIKNLNKYTTIYASPDMDKEHGVIYLDTINDDRIYFKSYETIEKEKKEQEQLAKEKEKKKKNDEEKRN